MVEEIKNLRIEIDGLSQLVKELQSPQEYIIDVASVPDNWDLQKVMAFHQEYKYVVLDSFKSKQSIEDAIKPLPILNKEIEKTYDSLLLAKAWLGKLLGELGTENPYGSGYKTVEDIVPTQDVNQDIHGYNLDVVHFEDKNYIEKVDWLRQEIQKIVNKTDPYRNYNNTHVELTTKGMSYLFNTNRHLCEARFWLGFEMGNIRDKANKEKNE